MTRIKGVPIVTTHLRLIACGAEYGVYQTEYRDGDFPTLLGSMEIDPDLLFWGDRAQAIDFAREYPQHLHPRNEATFFPFIEKEERFVAIITEGIRKLEIDVSEFTRRRSWFAHYNYRFVFPI